MLSVVSTMAVHSDAYIHPPLPLFGVRQFNCCCTRLVAAPGAALAVDVAFYDQVDGTNTVIT